MQYLKTLLVRDLSYLTLKASTNHIGHGNAYSLDIDAYWSSKSQDEGDGVQYTNLTFSNWKGTEENGEQRGPIKIQCPDAAPCTDITIEDFAMWTESGDEQTYSCRNAYGSGYCLQSGSGDDASSYSTALTATATPSAYAAPSMPNDLSTAFGTDSPIPIPTIPTSFFPGATPYSALAGAASSAIPSSSSSPVLARAYLPKETGIYPDFHGKTRRMVKGAAKRYPFGYYQ